MNGFSARAMLAAVAASGLLLSLSESAPAQSPGAGVLGYLNSDGTFRPINSSHAASPLQPSATVTGTFNLTLTITIASSLPAGTTIQCQFGASVTDVSATEAVDLISESATTTATGSSSSQTCHLSIPYSWTLLGSGDTVGLNYMITALDSKGNGRVSSRYSFETIALPKNGATTNVNLSARI